MAVSGGYYGEGKGEVLLSNVICEGTENGLEECIHSGFLRHTCGHNQDAGVQCRASGKLIIVLFNTCQHAHMGNVCDICGYNGLLIYIN